jgi:hypothetical protein
MDCDDTCRDITNMDNDDHENIICDYDSITSKNYTLLEYSTFNDFENHASISKTNELLMNGNYNKYTDLLDGILYNIIQRKRNTTVSFVSRGLFHLYTEKIKSEYDLITDENLKYSSYVNGVKCRISVDKPAGCIYVMGNGHNQWLKLTFVKTIKGLLKTYLDHSKLL